MMKPVVVAGFLVGDKSGHKTSAVATILQQLTEHSVFGNRFGIEPFTELKIKMVEPLVAQRTVDLRIMDFLVVVHPHRDGRKPFPIAEMGGVESHRFTFARIGIHLLAALKHNAAAHFLVADVKQLDGFYEYICEIAIEPADDTVLFLATLFRKRSIDILFHQFPAVAHHMIGQERQHIGNDIKHGQRQECRSVKKQPQRRIQDISYCSVHANSPLIRSSSPVGSTRRTIATRLTSDSSAGTSILK